jgi:indole-3-acetate monooxygenase
VTIAVDTDLLDRARALAPLIEAHAEAGEAGGTLGPEVVEAVAAAGLFATMVPRQLGGAEADAVTSLAVFEELARADGSAGWSIMANATTTCFAAIYTADAAVATLFGPDEWAAGPGGAGPVLAGMLGPMGQAVRTEAGFDVSGHYQFASGSGHSTWIGAGTTEMVDGEPAVTELGLPAMRVVFVPRRQVEFQGNWDVLGLRGTGSYDYELDRVAVDEDFSFLLLEATKRRGGPVYDIGLFGLTAVGHAAFALGVGRRAMDEIVEVARAKQRLGAEPIGDQQLFLHDFAMHDAALRAARSYTYEAFAEAEAAARQDGAPSVLEAQRMRQATTYATRMAAEAARFAYTWAGSTGLRNPSVIQRCLRDLSAGTQHLYVDNNTLTAYTQAVLAG